MQTQIPLQRLQQPNVQLAESILRKCVHCGFCAATCPTYQLLGDELDSPRGRIYLIKTLLEQTPYSHSQQNEVQQLTQHHLDRCLTCRACETTCPSGVDYAQLADIARQRLEETPIRPRVQRLQRFLLGYLLPRPTLNAPFFRLANALSGLLPETLQQKIPQPRRPTKFPAQHSPFNAGKVILLKGCIQSTVSPNTHHSAKFLLSRMGYQVIEETEVNCCGAINYHLSQTEPALKRIRKNLQSWQKLDTLHDLKAIISTASGCGVQLKDYPQILQQHEDSQLASLPLLSKIKDISELLEPAFILKHFPDFKPHNKSIAFHAPCTLQHGLRLSDALQQKLQQLGYQLQSPANAHLCCGSAGTYSLLQPELSRQLRDNKVNALQQLDCDTIITANVGCEHHLNGACQTPVKHWVEILAEDLVNSSLQVTR